MVRVGLMLATVATLLVGCASLTPGNVQIPSGVPITLPSGLQIPPGLFPSGNFSSAVCQLATPAEVGQIMGAPISSGDSSDTSCSYITSGLSGVSLSIDTGSDLSGVKAFLGNAKDITVGGLPGVSGAFFGQAVVYVQKGATQLTVLGILTGTDDATMGKLVQIATIAASRLP